VSNNDDPYHVYLHVLGFAQVSVNHSYLIPLLQEKAFQGVDDDDGAMHAPGAADSDGKIGLSLLFIEGVKKVMKAKYFSRNCCVTSLFIT